MPDWDCVAAGPDAWDDDNDYIYSYDDVSLYDPEEELDSDLARYFQYRFLD